MVQSQPVAEHLVAKQFLLFLELLGIIGILVVEALQPYAITNQFQYLEQIISFCLVYSAVQNRQIISQLFLILSVCSAIILHFYVQLGLCIASSAFFYISMLSNQDHYVSKFSYGMAGAYYSLLTSILSTNSFNIRYASSALFINVVMEACFQDVAGATMQLVFFSVLKSSITFLTSQQKVLMYIGISVSACMIGWSVISTVYKTYTRKEEQKRNYRKLQSHAVMNAYITIKEQ